MNVDRGKKSKWMWTCVGGSERHCNFSFKKVIYIEVVFTKESLVDLNVSQFDQFTYVCSLSFPLKK